MIVISLLPMLVKNLTVVFSLYLSVDDLDGPRGLDRKLGSDYTAQSAFPGATPAFTMPAIADSRYQNPDMTTKNMNMALGVFRRWLFEQGYGHRDTKIEDMPVRELDAQLSEFFATVKKRNGTDYDPQSFKVMRSYLSRYLKQQNYPLCITKSSEFERSLLAYKKRMQHLHEISVLRRKGLLH